jgi:hypothetical protein
MFVVQFTTPLGCEEPAEALFRAMTAASRIQPHWQTTGPSAYESGKWEFSGMTRDDAHGYELIQFDVRNYKPSAWPPPETEGSERPEA